MRWLQGHIQDHCVQHLVEGCCALLANILTPTCYCSDSSLTILQGNIYNHCVQQLVDGCFAGYNATVLAYGQTGSGKTHTMGTSVNAAAAEEEDYGITPRVIRSDTVPVPVLQGLVAICNILRLPHHQLASATAHDATQH